jgi:hypothetical protein
LLLARSSAWDIRLCAMPCKIKQAAAHVSVLHVQKTNDTQREQSRGRELR